MTSFNLKKSSKILPSYDSDEEESSSDALKTTDQKQKPKQLYPDNITTYSTSTSSSKYWELEDGMKEKKLGICMRTDVHEGPYSIIWHPELGELAVRNKGIKAGTWVLFDKPAEGQKTFVECVYKKAIDADSIEITEPRRPGREFTTDHLISIQVMGIVNSIDYCFNEHYNMCTDALLGGILVGRSDKFIYNALENKQPVELAVACIPHFAPGHHWVAIAVNKPLPDGCRGENYCVLYYLPRVLTHMAKKYYPE